MGFAVSVDRYNRNKSRQLSNRHFLACWKVLLFITIFVFALTQYSCSLCLLFIKQKRAHKEIQLRKLHMTVTQRLTEVLRYENINI